MKNAICLALALFAFGCCFGHVAGCKGASVPSTATLEAGVEGVNGLCTFLEGVTENQTVISTCATVEEIAWLVAAFAPMLAKESDAGACTPVGSMCATPLQLGKMIQALHSHRRAMFFLDAGAR